MSEQDLEGRAILATVPLITAYSPTITVWNRLEGRPRSDDFSRALKAEIRDPLWMLSKQWQLGEFQGEDAASAVLAKVHIKTTELTKYQSGESNASSIEANIPLEVEVEHQAIPFMSGKQEISLDIRLLMGRHWLKLLSLLELPDADSNIHKKYIATYGFTAPNPENKTDIKVCAHLEVWQQYAAIAKRSLDGYKLYQNFKSPTDTDLVDSPVGREGELQNLRLKFITWFEKLYYQPDTDNNHSWKPSRLEYQFTCSAPQQEKEKVLIADEYYQGHLDWYNLDIHNQKEMLTIAGDDVSVPTQSVENQFTLNFIPSPVMFLGMPHNRWWTLEDRKTNLGNINPNTTDINQLMLLDFSLNYANDWFIVPFTLPIGSIANISGVMVTNVFGEKIWVEAAVTGANEVWDKWGMFNLNVRGNMEVPTDLSLLLLPTAPKVLQGKPLEEVFLIRDEIANMVWGVESKIPLATGKSKEGREAGLELRNKYQQFVAPGSEPQDIIENDAKIKYQIVNTVPEEWIPFIPVHKEGSNRQIQLQRAAMPRILEGNTNKPEKIEPRTSILRDGLDKGGPYFLHEEEVPRSGIKVHKSFQRTRWLNGKVFTWISFRKQVGRGEGRSGLAFDQIVLKK